MLDKRLLGLVIIVGLVAGFIGFFFTPFFHFIQHFFFFFFSSESLTFFQAVARVSPENRFL